jgi:hypothetical protein
MGKSGGVCPEGVKMSRFWLVALGLVAFIGIVASSDASGGQSGAADLAAPADPVALLQERLDRGEVELEYVPGRGYLDSILDLLEVPASSQMFVFSKTSLQSELINPDEPRALYFSDDLYVGFVRRGPVLEFASIDPVRGTVFYTLSQEETDTPKFQAEGIRCIQCHLPSQPDVPVPRLMVMSVMPNENGEALGTDVSLITDASPLNRRWGGWFVTGTGGDVIHRGNSVIGNSRGENWSMGTEPHLAALGDRFDVSPYLRSDSNIVPLLLLVHQSQIHNLIGDAAYAARAAIEEEARRERFMTSADPAPSEQTLHRIAEVSEPLVEGLLFVDAVPLEHSVRSSSEFRSEFESLGPRDSRGRSLRDLDLGDRLLRYPLSYLVYSEQFDQLPDLVRAYVYRRLGEILSGQDPDGRFANLTREDRQAIHQILMDTRSEYRGFVEAAD